MQTRPCLNKEKGRATHRNVSKVHEHIVRRAQLRAGTNKTHLISASCIQEMGRLVESPRGSNSALPAGRSARPSIASTNGTDGDFLIVHFAGAAAVGFTDVAVESEEEKERTGRAALTKANMLDVGTGAGITTDEPKGGGRGGERRMGFGVDPRSYRCKSANT